MVSPDAKDGEIDVPVPLIRHFEWSDGLGSTSACEVFHFAPNFHSAVIFHLVVLLLQLFLGCTNENMREEDAAAEAL